MSLIHCNLRVLMAERGLNIQDVKDKTTLSRTTISNLYNNYGTGVQFGTLRELCELLKCQPGDLLSYIDVGVEFKVVTEEPEVSKEVSKKSVDDEGDDYVSSISTALDIDCKIMYEGINHEFKFSVEIKYGIDEEKNICSLNIGTSLNYDYNLDKLKLIPYVEDYIGDQFDNFLISWGLDFFYGEEILDVTNMSIEYNDLLK